MHRITLLLGIAILALAAASSGTARSSRGASLPTLRVVVKGSGPVKVTHAGKVVTKLRPGWYTVSIQDYSTSRNFHLRGKGVNKKTGKKFRGSALWGVHLRKGQYSYGSDPLGGGATQRFRVP